LDKFNKRVQWLKIKSDLFGVMNGFDYEIEEKIRNSYFYNLELDEK
jgi:hypothetical protein